MVCSSDDSDSDASSSSASKRALQADCLPKTAKHWHIFNFQLDYALIKSTLHLNFISEELESRSGQYVFLVSDNSFNMKLFS